MPALAVSPVDVLLVIGLGAAGFLVVALVCAGVLAMLQLILPSNDAGAAAIDRLDQPDGVDQGGESGAGGPAPVDAEVDA